MFGNRNKNKKIKVNEKEIRSMAWEEFKKK